ncbi:MAG: helix-turn-helix transcriptional regulator [Deltaproteobacteria bacterium]|nr:helix-turn-helix transcriptional regulator [Deltaproteobacteria bacterium]
MEKQEDFRACSVARTLRVLGDKWLFLILREAFFGVKNYDDFQAKLGIATNVLSGRLKTLVENGVLKREQDPADGRKVTYRLTEKGVDLYPIVLALMRWGDRWLADESGPPLILHHKPCGERLEPVTCCKACGGEVLAQDIRYEEAGGKPRGPDGRGT